MIWQGLVVEIIRILWDHGLYRQNPWLQRIHDYWFDYWVEFKTQQTMKDVDDQAKCFPGESGVPDPIYTEQKEGPTALGGEMRLTAPWVISEQEESGVPEEE